MIRTDLYSATASCRNSSQYFRRTSHLDIPLLDQQIPISWPSTSRGKPQVSRYLSEPRGGDGQYK